MRAMHDPGEDWPEPPCAKGCGCRRCGAGDLDRIVGRELSVALRHAQDRFAEAGAGAEGAGPIVRYGRRMPLPDFLASGDGRYKDPGLQWNYRFYLKGDNRPLYVGKAGRVQGGLRGRILRHLREGTRRPGIRTAKDAVDAAIRHRRAPKLPGEGDSRLLDDIIASLGTGAFDFQAGDVVVRRGGPGAPAFAPAPRGAALMTERLAIYGGNARINRPDRVEDEGSAEAALDAAVLEEIGR